MRKPMTATFLILAVPVAAMAGEIFGSANPQAANLEVQVVCGDQKQNTYTDTRGFYRLYIPRQGECKLSVRRASGTWSEPLIIFSSERPARYDFVIKGNRLERQ